MKIINKSLNKYQQGAVIIFVAMSVMSCFQYYETGFFAMLYSISRWIPLICSIIFIPYLLKRKYNKYEIILLFEFIIMILLTIVSMIFDYSGNVSYLSIGCYILLGIQTEYLFDDKTIFNCLKILSVIGIIMFVYFFFVDGYDFSKIIGRSWSGYVWSKSFYFAPIMWGTPYFVLLSHIKGQEIGLSSITWAVYVLWNLMFLKRFVFVDTLILALYLLFHYIKLYKIDAKKTVKLIGGVLLISIFFTVLLKDNLALLFKSVLDRFKDSAGNISSFDRIVELTDYLKHANFINILLGGGFVHKFVTEDNMIRYNLHIGWGDLFFHGGLVFLLIYLIPHFKIPSFLKNYKNISNTLKLYLGILAINSIRYLYMGPYVFQPQMLLTVLSVLYIARGISKKDYIISHIDTNIINR